MRQCSLAILLVLATASPLAGQLQVSGLRDLNFGVVILGVQSAVSPADPVKSGWFYVRYVTGGRVQVRFNLPSSLGRVGGGGNLPITFRNGDALFQGTAAGSPAQSFNPNAVTNQFLLNPNPDANIWIGGRVSPTGALPTGAYVGTIVMTVTVF